MEFYINLTVEGGYEAMRTEKFMVGGKKLFERHKGYELKVGRWHRGKSCRMEAYPKGEKITVHATEKSKSQAAVIGENSQYRREKIMQKSKQKGSLRR